MKKIVQFICDIAPAFLVCILAISCFVWFGTELINAMDHRAEVVKAKFSEVGR